MTLPHLRRGRKSVQTAGATCLSRSGPTRLNLVSLTSALGRGRALLHCPTAVRMGAGASCSLQGSRCSLQGSGQSCVAVAALSSRGAVSILVVGGRSIRDAHAMRTLDCAGRRLHQAGVPCPGGMSSRRVAERWGTRCACWAFVHEVFKIGMVPELRACGVHPEEACITLDPLAAPSARTLALDADDAQLDAVLHRETFAAQMLE